MRTCMSPTYAVMCTGHIYRSGGTKNSVQLSLQLAAKLRQMSLRQAGHWDSTPEDKEASTHSVLYLLAPAIMRHSLQGHPRRSPLQYSPLRSADAKMPSSDAPWQSAELLQTLHPTRIVSKGSSMPVAGANAIPDCASSS